MNLTRMQTPAADGHECKWCANLISCMHCHGVIDRDESYQHYSNGTYLCEECDSNLCCHSCGNPMGVDLMARDEKYYHKGCMPDKAHE